MVVVTSHCIQYTATKADGIAELVLLLANDHRWADFKWHVWIYHVRVSSLLKRGIRQVGVIVRDLMILRSWSHVCCSQCDT